MDINALKNDPQYVPVEHPYLEFAEVDDIWVRAYNLEKQGSIAAQHTHAHDHITLVSRGSVQVWQDGVEMGVFVAPTIIKIKAGSQHTFTALTDDVVLCCLHNLRGTGFESPEIMEGV